MARQRARGQQRIMIVEVSDRRAIDASNSSDSLRFTNHSCRPNAVLLIRQGRVEFYAMRDVAPGEDHRQLRCNAPRRSAALPLRRGRLHRPAMSEDISPTSIRLPSSACTSPDCVWPRR